MNYLSIQSFKKIDKYFRLFGQISSYKISSYLSFVLNSRGDQLHYDRKLNRNYIYTNPSDGQKKSSKFVLQEYLSTINKDFLYTQSLLTGSFTNHILNLQQTDRLLQNSINLDLKNKKDMINYMFGVKNQYDIKQWIQSKIQNINDFHINQKKCLNLNWRNIENNIPQNKRKNFFIVIDSIINGFQQIQSDILQKYHFFDVPNVNKIICLDLNLIDMHKFNQKIIKNQNFLKQKNIKIKSLYADKIPQKYQCDQKILKGYKIFKLIEYLKKNIKGNILLHQYPQFYECYNQFIKLQNNPIKNMQSLVPTQIMLLIQRDQYLFRNIQNKNNFFQNFNKSFTYRYQRDPFFKQTKTDFIVSRYLSKQNKKKIQKLIKMQLQGKIDVADQ